MIICRDCGVEFKEKKERKGFYNQCDDCSDDIPRYLGFNDGSLNKSVNISVYRGQDPNTRHKIQNQKSRVGI
jgi:hypothetical protein